MNENILFDESSNEALIKACTIHKLIERLTYHKYTGGTYIHISVVLGTL